MEKKRVVEINYDPNACGVDEIIINGEVYDVADHWAGFEFQLLSGSVPCISWVHLNDVLKEIGVTALNSPPEVHEESTEFTKSLDIVAFKKVLNILTGVVEE